MINPWSVERTARHRGDPPLVRAASSLRVMVDHMLGYLPYFGFIGVMLAIVWWVRRRAREIDSVIEREYKDPPIADVRQGTGSP
jgi:hypothetical protein